MYRGKMSFVTGVVVGALLCGAVVVFSAVGIYQPKPDGDWIRDVNMYQPGTDDQINVLADIQPGGGVLMMEIGLRLNALRRAGKKRNWGLAAYEASEMQEAMEKLEVTRPSLQAFLESFIGSSLAGVNGAITAQDKTQFKTAIDNMASDCTGCHVTFGKGFLVIKPGRSALPIR